MSTLTIETKQQIVLSAYAAVGTGDPESGFELSEQIRQKVVELTVAALDVSNDRSRLGGAINQIEQSQPFPAVLVGVKRDDRNGRGIVGFKADRPGQQANENGVETISTEPEYFPEGAAMIARARELKGHRVLIFKQVEQFEKDGQTKKGKVLRHLLDLGLPKDDNEAN